jgi:uncharacterized protein (TIGR02996 family)
MPEPSSSEEDQFLRHILAAPDDHARRLVFADWLLDRDDPRGELIRLQCDLARLSEADERYAALAARERECLARDPRALAGRWWDPQLAFRYRLGLPARLGHAGFFTFATKEYRQAQRFFLDGTVVTVTTTINTRPRQLARWFQHDYSDRGTYALEIDLEGGGLALRYASTAPGIGTVEYEGLLRGQTLTARSHSHINGHRGEYTFTLWGLEAADSRSD